MQKVPKKFGLGSHSFVTWGKFLFDHEAEVPQKYLWHQSQGLGGGQYVSQ